jgi:DNA-binding CsgD family transcriptional regulator/sugar-specific transcriptional regulator TrmB
MLETLGLSGTNYEVYVALLKEPDLRPEEILGRLDIASPDLDAALGRLVQLNLIRTARDDSGRIVLMNPDSTLAPVLQRLEAELDEQRARLSRDRAVLMEFSSDYAARNWSRSDDGVECLTGVDAVRNRLSELSQQARCEVKSFMPGGALSAAALASSRPLDEQSIRSGVRMYTVYLDSVRNDLATTEYAAWFNSIGGETRTTPSLPMRMIICDGTTAVIPVNQEASREGAFVIHYKSMVRALEELFDVVWEQATPLGGPHPLQADDKPTPRELTLLKMLEQGMTDERMARRMGVSLRTIRRNMADLLQRLNAQSRFQAGVEATRRGWM